MSKKQEPMIKNKGEKRKIYSLFPVSCFLFLSSLPLLWNLLRPGFYASHDGEWMAIRLTAFHDALRQGQFPVRWLPRLNHSYGYPVTNFLYPLPFYLSEPIYFLTGNPATAIQFIMAISVISMAVGMLSWFYASNNQQTTNNKQQNLKNWSAIVGTLVYIYSPYIAFDLYQRGSLGEIVAMGIIPWIFWAISRNGAPRLKPWCPEKPSFAKASEGYPPDYIRATSAEADFPIHPRVNSWFSAKADKLPLAAILGAGLILSHNVVAILFLPLIVVYNFYKSYKSYKNYKWVVFSLVISLSLSAFFWLPALAELRFVRAGQISVSDFQNEYLSLSKTLDRAGIITVFFSGGLPLFFLTKSSSWLWETLKFAQVIQFPWRTLSLFSFVAAIVSAKFITKISGIKGINYIIGIIIIIISFASSIKYLTPASFINRPPEYYQTNDDTTTVRAEYTPIWVTDLPKQRPETPQTHYYPGWKIFIDGKKAPIADPSSTNGVLLPAIPPANPINIKYRFTETPLRTFANLLSVAAALVWLKWLKKQPKPNPRTNAAAFP